MCRIRWFLSGLGLLAVLVAAVPSERPEPPRVLRANTFSIVAHDAERKEWGVATASRVLAVGAGVPWAKANAGAVATQSYVNVTYGPRGLELLSEGKSAEQTVKALIDADKDREYRQVAVVDAKGHVAQFTGAKCIAWAGSKSGKDYVCLGNLLAGEAVVEQMAKAYEESKERRLAWRLLAALEAAEKAGGDKRGKQSAAVLVARENGGPNGFGDRAIDLRVDDHETPIPELARILAKQLPRGPAD